MNKWLGILLYGLVSIAKASELASFTIPHSGIYRVTHQQLLNAGLDLGGVDVTRLGLKMNHRIVAHKIFPTDSSYFTADSYIEFPAQGLDTRYSGENKYILVIDEGGHLITKDTRVLPDGAVQYSYRAKARYAPQNKFTHYSPDWQDSWYADRLLAITEPVDKRVSLDVLDYASNVPFFEEGMDDIRPELEINLWGGTALPGNGLTAPDHHVLVELNGRRVSDVRFDGLSAYKIYERLDGALNNGFNQVRISLPKDHAYPFDIVYLDEVTLYYPRKFRALAKATLEFESKWDKFSVANLDSPEVIIYRIDADEEVVEITTKQVECLVLTIGCRVNFPGSDVKFLSQYYLATETGIKTPKITILAEKENLFANPAKVLLLAHPNFIDTTDKLLEKYSKELASLYGSADIVNIEHVYAQYSGHVQEARAIARYIHDAYHYRDTMHVVLVGGDNYDYRNYLGTEAKSFVPSLYVRVGVNVNSVASDAKYADIDGDNIPDLQITRLPVRMESELKRLLNKRANYLRRNYSHKALLSADRVDASGFSFKTGSQQAVANNFSNWQIDHVYLDDIELNQARQSLMRKLNSGVSLTSFFGHSSTNAWSLYGLLSGDDIAMLQNNNKPTVVTQWGCWNTFYNSPTEDSMAQRFLFEQGGAVTVMGSVSLTQAKAENEMARLLFAEFSKGKRIGEAVLAAKRTFANSHPYQYDVLLGWNVLGPSDMVLNRVR